MPVQVVCQSCTKSIRAPDHFIGKRVKCPGCGASLSVTDPFDIALGGGPNGAAAPPQQELGGGYAPAGRRSAWGKYHLGLAIMAITVLASSGLVGLCLLIGVLATNLTMFQVAGYLSLGTYIPGSHLYR
jgi:hypothetical protein